MYMSGLPLHVLAMALVQRFRWVFGDRFPVSFSAGIDEANFADAVALGLKPVTVCSDLLKVGGYGRGIRYLTALEKRMDAVGARTIDEYIVKAFGHGEAALNELALAPRRAQACRLALRRQERSGSSGGRGFSGLGFGLPAAQHGYLCRSAGRRSALRQRASSARHRARSAIRWYCSTAWFRATVACRSVPTTPTSISSFRPAAIRWNAWCQQQAVGAAKPPADLVFEKHRQIGNFADACNECGNCDVFCPEDGGPQFAKPRFFGSVAAWKAAPDRDGFAFAVHGDTLSMHGRFGGQEVLFEQTPGGKSRYAGTGFDIRLDLADPLGSVEGHADAPVDLRWLRMMDLIRIAVAAPAAHNFISAGLLLAQSQGRG